MRIPGGGVRAPVGWGPSRRGHLLGGGHGGPLGGDAGQLPAADAATGGGRDRGHGPVAIRDASAAGPLLSRAGGAGPAPAAPGRRPGAAVPLPGGAGAGRRRRRARDDAAERPAGRWGRPEAGVRNRVRRRADHLSGRGSDSQPAGTCAQIGPAQAADSAALGDMQAEAEGDTEDMNRERAETHWHGAPPAPRDQDAMCQRSGRPPEFPGCRSQAAPQRFRSAGTIAATSREAVAAPGQVSGAAQSGWPIVVPVMCHAPQGVPGGGHEWWQPAAARRGPPCGAVPGGWRWPEAAVTRAGRGRCHPGRGGGLGGGAAAAPGAFDDPDRLGHDGAGPVRGGAAP